MKWAWGGGVSWTVIMVMGGGGCMPHTYKAWIYHVHQVIMTTILVITKNKQTIKLTLNYVVINTINYSITTNYTITMWTTQTSPTSTIDVSKSHYMIFHRRRGIYNCFKCWCYALYLVITWPNNHESRFNLNTCVVKSQSAWLSCPKLEVCTHHQTYTLCFVY